MATSLLTNPDKYGLILLRITQYAGIFMPMFVILYGVAASYGIAPISELFRMEFLVTAAIAYTVIGIGQFVQGYKNNALFVFYISCYHIISAAFLIWISGFNSPITAFWIVIVSISEIFLGKIAMWYSLALLFATALVSFALDKNLSVMALTTSLAYVLVIAVVSIVLSRLRSVETLEYADLKQSREQEEIHKGQLMTLVNSISESILSISSTGTVQVYNSATLGLLDTNESLTGKNIDDIFHTYTQEGEPVKLTSILPDVTRLVEREDLSHRFPDGEEIRLSVSAAPIKQAFSSQFVSNEGYLFIFRDITKSKSLEEERDEFISVISHELRTPITIVEGTLSNAQLFLSRGAKLEDINKSIKDAHDQILFLASMVNDLGTLSRAERGVGNTPEEIDIQELMHELFNRYQPRATEAGLALNLDMNTRVGKAFTSRLYLEEVLQNFITNSIKYTKEGSVTLIVKRTKEGVYFAVKDTGIGISKSDLKHISEKFWRSEDYRTRETSGTGLGLYVVQKLAKKLKIKVDIDSRINHGSTFSFTLHDEKPKSA
jgi:signal transduction histidine kinase